MAAVTPRIRLQGLRCAQALAADVIAGLTPEEWASPSAAQGWTVHDVVAHMSSAMRDFFGLLILQVARSTDIEGLNEAPVQVRRSWSDAAVAAEYRRWAPRGRRALGLTQLPGIGSVAVPMGELGRFPARVLPSAIAFDTHTHLYHDIAPALRNPLPPPEPAVITATLEWMMLVAASMGATTTPLSEGQSLGLRFTGPGGADWLLTRAAGALTARAWAGEPVLATVTGPAADYPSWGTRRKSWREFDIDISGDVHSAEAVLDCLRVV